MWPRTLQVYQQQLGHTVSFLCVTVAIVTEYYSWLIFQHPVFHLNSQEFIFMCSSTNSWISESHFEGWFLDATPGTNYSVTQDPGKKLMMPSIMVFKETLIKELFPKVWAPSRDWARDSVKHPRINILEKPSPLVGQKRQKELTANWTHRTGSGFQHTCLPRKQ